MEKSDTTYLHAESQSVNDVPTQIDSVQTDSVPSAEFEHSATIGLESMEEELENMAVIHNDDKDENDK